MLKKSLLSPAQPRCAETHLSPSIVLASFRLSTGTRPLHHSPARSNLLLLIRRTVRPGEAGQYSFSAAFYYWNFVR